MQVLIAYASTDLLVTICPYDGMAARFFSAFYIEIIVNFSGTSAFITLGIAFR